MQNGYKEKNSQGNFTTFDRKSQETEDHLNENNQQFFVKRIGRTNFKVNVFFSETEKETLEDKILRIIRRETLENGAECGIINKSWFCSQSTVHRTLSWTKPRVYVPQMSRSA